MTVKIANFFIAFVVLLSSIFRIDLGYGLNPTKKTLDLEGEGYRLVWSDEFKGDSLDKNKWNDEQSVDGCHWGAVRRGGYWHKDLISVHDGNLDIAVKYVDEDQAARYGGDYKAGWYTAYVTTRLSNPEDETNPDDFLYGYFETRAKLPGGFGIWSAFWMMNKGVYEVGNDGKDGTEIDVFESLYTDRAPYKTGKLIGSNLHWDGYGESHVGYHVGSVDPQNDPYNEYNTYGVKWTPDEYVFYINGCETARTGRGGVSQNPEFLLLSIEIAGENGVLDPESKISENTDGMNFLVDYVRVYQIVK